ncbi:uncharacterized protein BXZ73DRAFT_107871 [Epithele typhae]|uniref:uncharacterized protein n=1 Tax=Epithele typhae TaxID=378194 RepID=UPI002007911E|nr:uncharacterized protein BXZ73DRAFT_107871 [Epithele typhae]KAH9911685.1 hypothetical protein BXZ73DRAFT_107871 [Epithele typhae]
MKMLLLLCCKPSVPIIILRASHVSSALNGVSKPKPPNPMATPKAQLRAILDERTRKEPSASQSRAPSRGVLSPFALWVIFRMEGDDAILAPIPPPPPRKDALPSGQVLNPAHYHSFWRTLPPHLLSGPNHARDTRRTSQRDLLPDELVQVPMALFPTSAEQTFEVRRFLAVWWVNAHGMPLADGEDADPSSIRRGVLVAGVQHGSTQTLEGSFTIGELTSVIATSLNHWIAYASNLPAETCWAPHWRVGRKGIRLEDVFLMHLAEVEVDQTHTVWMPLLEVAADSGR